MSERLLPYRYDLPATLIAKHPPVARDGGRLLVLDDNGECCDGQIRDIVSLVRRGDLLVVNDTAVLRARLAAVRASGGRVELLVMPDPDEPDCFLAMARPSRRLRKGEVLALTTTAGEQGEGLSDMTVLLGEKRPDGSIEVTLRPSAEAVMERVGNIPIPPYLHRAASADDDERYQTIFRAEAGAIAAPTAGLHITRSIVNDIEAKGARIATVTLHVGPGTFRKLRPEDLESGRLHRERYSIPADTARAVNATRAAGGRVIAIGTTSTRTLESAVGVDGQVRAGVGNTDLFIRPGYQFRVVDRLWTNFHLPESSLLMLACAFGGTKRIMSAYRHAVESQYRFYSYGDAMWIAPWQDAERLGG